MYSKLVLTVVQILACPLWVTSSEAENVYYGDRLVDLAAQESRYKVVAKPVPYKPDFPAPDLDHLKYSEINPSSTTSTTTESPSRLKAGNKRFKNYKNKSKYRYHDDYDDANVIYPTTTYRPQKFQLSELLANHNNNPSISKYLPTAAPKSTTTASPTRFTTQTSFAKSEFINEVPYGIRKKKNSNASSEKDAKL